MSTSRVSNFLMSCSGMLLIFFGVYFFLPPKIYVWSCHQYQPCFMDHKVESSFLSSLSFLLVNCHLPFHRGASVSLSDLILLLEKKNKSSFTISLPYTNFSFHFPLCFQYQSCSLLTSCCNFSSCFLCLYFYTLNMHLL